MEVSCQIHVPVALYEAKLPAG